MRTVTTLAASLGLVAVGVRLATPEPALAGAALGVLALVVYFTASPLRIGRASHTTWFDRPDGNVVVHGATRAAARTAR